MFGAWVAVTEAYNAAMLARESARAAAEVRAITQVQDNAMGIALLTDRRMRRDHTLHPGDCQSCGSHEFRRWQGVSVCAYCRSTAAAPVSAAAPSSIAERQAAWAKVGVRYHAERRHALARITTD